MSECLGIKDRCLHVQDSSLCAVVGKPHLFPVFRPQAIHTVVEAPQTLLLLNFSDLVARSSQKLIYSGFKTVVSEDSSLSVEMGFIG